MRAMISSLSSIDAWIFDLDNTLYPARANLMERIDARMMSYIVRQLELSIEDAKALQKEYFFEFGSSLVGLIAHHDVEPYEFLAEVHDIEMDVLEHDAPLAAAIAKLPGRKLVFTNGDKPYALRVLDRLGLGSSFEAIHDLHAMNLVPKPHPSAYAGLCRELDIDPNHAAFFDDVLHNLIPAKAIGMKTIWVNSSSGKETEAGEDQVDWTVPELGSWLRKVMGVA